MYYVDRIPVTEATALAFVDHLQSQNSYAVGFLTRVAIAQAIARGRVLRAYENGEPAGYMIHGVIGQTTRILQTVVADDARRVSHATAMVEALEILANHAQAHELSLHCADDLEANQFWQAIGFQPCGRRLRSREGKRWQIRYRKPLPGEKMADIMRQKALSEAGLSNLHRLLCKRHIQIGQMDITRGRRSAHQIELGDAHAKP